MSENVQSLLARLGSQAREAAHVMSCASAEKKSLALRAAADVLASRKAELKEANEKDMEFGQSKNLTLSQLDRLYLDDARIDGIVSAIRKVAEIPDPVGKILRSWVGDNGLRFEKVAVPIGVIGVIYESRPNVTADAASLCFKAGNSVILRSGSESFHSASVITDCMREGLRQSGMPEDSVQLIPSRDRSAVGALLGCAEYVDVVVPRGGKSLIARVQSEARMPVFAHLEGLCHTYIDKSADIRKAKAVVFNAKLRRTGICGATETLLIHKDFSEKATHDIIGSLQAEGCEIRACEGLRSVMPNLSPATEDDWFTEYLDKILSVRIVDDLDAAIEHINHYGSHHTDAILTEDKAAAEKFMSLLDSAIILHNASTQYADGGEFGMGAEIGISTGRIHARGPVGVDELTVFKYRVFGDGHCRA